MAKKTKERLSHTQKIELLEKFAKGIGKGIIELAKSGPAPRYAITTLGLYALGRTCRVPCGLIGSIQGVNTLVTVHEVIDESGIISGITSGVISGTSGIAAGVLMNDILAEKCKCPKIISEESWYPGKEVKEKIEKRTERDLGPSPIEQLLRPPWEWWE